MPKTVSQISALALVVCFVLCQPAVIAASTLSLTPLSSQPKLTGPGLNNVNGSATPLTIASEQPSTKSNNEKSEAVSAQKTIEKDSLRFQVSKSSKKAYLKSANRFRKLAHHSPLLGASDDCDACHNQCLIGSAARIAISILTACAPCGLVCLAAQAACQITCNGTTACKNRDLPVVNDN